MFWGDLWETKSSDYIYAEIPGNMTKTGLDQKPLVSKAGYIRIFLKTSRIETFARGWKEFLRRRAWIHLRLTARRWHSRGERVHLTQSAAECRSEACQPHSSRSIIRYSDLSLI